MMTELTDVISDLLHSAHETMDGVACSPDSGLSSCSDSEPSSPPLSQHFTQLTNANLTGFTEEEEKESSVLADWLQTPCGVYPPYSEDPHQWPASGGDDNDKAWDSPASLQLPASVSQHPDPPCLSAVKEEWVESKAGIQVCHTGNGNAKVKLAGGPTYDIDMNIDIPCSFPPLVKTEMAPDKPSRFYYNDNKYMYIEDTTNNNNDDKMMLQAYTDDNCNDCYLNRTCSGGLGHCVQYQYQDVSHVNAPAASPDNRLPARKRQAVTRTERLWEFILRLLGDPKHNPDLIEWVDRNDGTFRLNNSKAIAHMWGMRKNNVQMTYEKLSRALRYYYHRQILEPVLGKKLVYRFGPNATQVWENRVYRPQGSK